MNVTPSRTKKCASKYVSLKTRVGQNLGHVADNLVTKKQTFVVIASQESAGEKLSFVDKAEAKFWAHKTRQQF